MSPEVCLKSIHSSDVFQGSLYLLKKARLTPRSQSEKAGRLEAEDWKFGDWEEDCLVLEADAGDKYVT